MGRCCIAHLRMRSVQRFAVSVSSLQLRVVVVEWKHNVHRSLVEAKFDTHSLNTRNRLRQASTMPHPVQSQASLGASNNALQMQNKEFPLISPAGASTGHSSFQCEWSLEVSRVFGLLMTSPFAHLPRLPFFGYKGLLRCRAMNTSSPTASS